MANNPWSLGSWCRRRPMATKLRKALEHLFSEDNFTKDGYLQHLEGKREDKFIALQEICEFPKMVKLKATVSSLAEIVSTSCGHLLALSPDHLVRRSTFCHNVSQQPVHPEALHGQGGPPVRQHLALFSGWSPLGAGFRKEGVRLWLPTTATLFLAMEDETAHDLAAEPAQSMVGRLRVLLMPADGSAITKEPPPHARHLVQLLVRPRGMEEALAARAAAQSTEGQLDHGQPAQGPSHPERGAAATTAPAYDMGWRDNICVCCGVGLTAPPTAASASSKSPPSVDNRDESENEDNGGSDDSSGPSDDDTDGDDESSPAGPTALTKHHIVPYLYRHYFPHALKAHLSHDVVLLCHACHERYEQHADCLKTTIAHELGLSLGPDVAPPQAAPTTPSPGIAPPTIPAPTPCPPPAAPPTATIEAESPEDRGKGEPAVWRVASFPLALAELCKSAKVLLRVRKGELSSLPAARVAALEQQIWDAYRRSPGADLDAVHEPAEVPTAWLGEVANPDRLRALYGVTPHGQAVITRLLAQSGADPALLAPRPGEGRHRSERLPPSGAPELPRLLRADSIEALDRIATSFWHVDFAASAFPALVHFIQRWRRHFVETMAPRYLPDHWSADNGL
ncbi:hypothetical protein PAPYR_7449 [Paratrimastix pyriformis]|uniref:HTH La-type RNA-binding domain-containing protein n=1 Tax=Paratrimastix pyriformis TaxID=342808 RepID=A0ABQ8UK57_9EUKA|nr:hypothetical protein PAPYR_7449 [Paratrimastix pyriformis]